jgi:hypothetical protein
MNTKDRDIEVVRNFKNLGILINDTKNETEETKFRILAASKATCSLQTIIRSKYNN